jgi:hypothetical protein
VPVTEEEGPALRGEARQAKALFTGDFKGALPVVFVGLSLNLGLIVMARGLFVTHAAPRPACILIAAASIALIGGLFSNSVGAVGAAMLAVGLGAVGLRMLKSVRRRLPSIND